MNPDKVIPEMVIATSVCPHPERWSAYDDMSTELEVLDFLRVLVIALKPEIIVETGCWTGHGTVALASGAVVNGFGAVHTCDLTHSAVTQTKTRLQVGESPLYPVTITQCSGIELINRLERIDFAFLDSGPDEIRCDELRALYPKLSPGGVVAIHDTGIHGWLREKYLPPLLRELGMQHIFFDTPRGLTLCRKQPEIYP